MISKRTLEEWRRDALVYKSIPSDEKLLDVLAKDNQKLRQCVVRLTQELLDLHLVRGK